MARDQWLNHRPVVRTGKINKKIILPAFSADCGPTRACIDTWYTEAATPEGFTSTALSTSFAFYNDTITFECWLNQIGVPGSGTKNLIYYRADQTVGFGVYFAIWIDDANRVNVRLRIGGGHVDNTSTVVIPDSEWCHIAVKYDSTNPGNAGLKIFLNGVLLQSISQAGVLSGTTGTLSAGIGQETGLFGPRADVKTLIDEIRFWHTAERTDLEIAACFDRHLNKVAADSIDDNLEYFPISETENASTITSAFGDYIMAGGTARVTREEYAPIKFGGSIIVKEYSVDVGAACSIVFPVTRPDGANHALFVSWQDEDDITHRLRLYSADPEVGEESVYGEVEDYNGERLPANFTFEFWNIDGEEECELEDDITIRISLTSNPTTRNDHTALVAATPTGNTTLAFLTSGNIDNPLIPTLAPSF